MIRTNRRVQSNLISILTNIFAFIFILTIVFNFLSASSRALAETSGINTTNAADENIITSSPNINQNDNVTDYDGPLNRGKAVFFMRDQLKDDKGTGKYFYPIDHAFDPGSKIFDLTKFEVDDINNNYIFNMSFQEINNVWGAPEGFSHQLIEIYIANPEEKNKGRIDTLKEGAFVSFDSDHPWNYMIKVMSWNNTSIFSAEDTIDSYGQKEGITSKLLPDNHTIQVSIPKKYLPSNPNQWYYYVLVGGQDGFGPDNFRSVVGSHDNWKFVGGSDSDYDPNVIDILDTGKGNRSQYKMLSAYNSIKGQYAVIYPVGPDDNMKPPLTEKEIEQGLYLKAIYGIGILVVILLFTVIILRRSGK